MKAVNSILLFVTIGFCFVSFAHDYGKGDSAESSCSVSLSGRHKSQLAPIDIRPSGRDEHMLPKLEAAVLELSQIAQELGYEVPPHKLIFAPSDKLAQLVAAGGYASPHWIDGQKVVQGAASMSGVYEFVVGGCPTCTSFYRDTTNFYEQVSIIAHVIGHNDHRRNNLLAMARNSDPIEASWDMALLLNKLYSQYDREEVMLYVQFLETMSGMSDFAKGSYEAPETFKRADKTIDRLKRIVSPTAGQDIDDANPYPLDKWPSKPTPSALQAFIENMPSGTPEWKKELAKLVEKRNAAYSANVKTKIMNEGWATFSQYFLLRHSSYVGDEALIAFSNLLKGVAPGTARMPPEKVVSNPYYLGLHSWMNLWQKFRKRPEVAALKNEKEMDKLFVEYAHSIMATSDDYRFVKIALDESWIRKMKLRLSRKLTQEEARANELPPRGPNGEEVSYNVVMSISADRIINAIARGVTTGHKQFPRLYIVDFNHRGKEVLYKHQVFKDYPVPLERFSAVQSLFILAQMHEKPVALDTIASSAWGKRNANLDSDTIRWYRMMGMAIPENLSAIENSPIRIKVFPEGKVTVFNLPRVELKEGTSINDVEEVVLDETHINQELTEELQGAVDYYLMDLGVTINEHLSKRLSGKQGGRFSDFDSGSRFFTEKTGKQLMDVLTRPVDSVQNHAPTSPAAIIEYENMVASRLPRALEKALSGETPIKFKKGKVQLRALPLQPRFQYDRRVYSKIAKAAPPAPIEGRYEQLGDFPPETDDFSDLSSGQGLPGSVWATPKQGKGQGGEGEGDPDDEAEGDPDDESEDRPEDFDGEGGDPSVVEFPADVWGEILKSQFELPNIRRTQAGELIVDDELDGLTQKSDSRIHGERTFNVMLENAVRMRPDLVKPKKGETSRERYARLKELVKVGASHTSPDQYVVRSWVEEKSPEFKAVVVFVIDLTGSVMGLPQEMAKRFVYNTVTLLKQNYKAVEVRFVGYDDKAYEFPEEKIWSTYLGGGNTDSEGYKLAEKILSEYNNEEYNKYVYGTGDSGSSDTEQTLEVIKRIYEDVQHMGYIENHTAYSYENMDFSKALRALSLENKWFDFTSIDKSPVSILKAMNEFFGKERNKERKGK
ncbi:MAG: SpoVR family protein [Bdellovibrionaceae bacterium]|nr:SpoVR family protein [Pseudobdellovibrionaceae bacterium]